MKVNNYRLGEIQLEADRIANLALTIKAAIEFDRDTGTISEYGGAMFILTDRLTALQEALAGLEVPNE